MNDYMHIKQDLSLIVNETEIQKNIDAFVNVDTNFMNTFASVKKSGVLVIESELLAKNFAEINFGLSRIL